MKSVCVFCGSSLGALNGYGDVARQLGAELATMGIQLIYGGSESGLMGIVANAVLENGGKVTAIMPKDLHEAYGHENSAELIIVGSMHERKQKMHDLSQAFIALPGGYGTFEEMFEALTWSQLGHHDKPCGFLNVSGYYDGLAVFLDTVHAQGFINKGDRELAFIADSIGELMDNFSRRR